MSTVERLACQSRPWRVFTQRLVLPWALGGAALRGDVLELGSGSGAMAAALLDRFDGIRLTATDVDPAMRAAASAALARYGHRAEVQDADATRLAFADASFDVVVSCIMLHHVIAWEAALAEVARVLRPGGTFVGYDLMQSGPNRLLHRVDGSTHRLASATDVRERLEALPFVNIRVRPALGGLVARFGAERAGA